MGLVPVCQPSTVCFVAVIVQCYCVVLWSINLLFLLSLSLSHRSVFSGESINLGAQEL